jgi:hypothetical protein
MNTGEMNHLSNDQFSELILGAPSPASELHLAECAHCRAELEKFSSSVDLFSTTSLKWSEIQPAQTPRISPRWQSARWAYAPVGWALAVAVLIAVGVPAWKYDRHPAPPTSQSATEDTPAEIAQDNALLQSVNVALNTNEDSPLPEYRLSTGRQRNAQSDSRVQ